MEVEETEEEEEPGYRITNKNPTQRFGEQRQGARTNQNNKAICAVAMQDTHKIW